MKVSRNNNKRKEGIERQTDRQAPKDTPTDIEQETSTKQNRTRWREKEAGTSVVAWRMPTCILWMLRVCYNSVVAGSIPCYRGGTQVTSAERAIRGMELTARQRKPLPQAPS